jgi:hypothetical protein
MKLFEIKTRFYGKDLHESASLGYVLAETEEAIYNHIENDCKGGDDWPQSVNSTKEKIIAAKGDFKTEYMGEFYDQKYGWKDLGEISSEDAAVLVRLKIAATAG